MKLLFTYIKQHKKALIFALILATINQVFSLLDPQILRLIIDQYATDAANYSQGEFIQGVFGLLVLAVFVALISRIAKAFQDYFTNVVTQKVGTSLYADSVLHAFSLPFSIFEDQRSGELLQKLQKARTDSQSLITSSINVIFLSTIGIAFVITYAFFVHWLIGLSYALIIPVVGSITFYINKRVKELQKIIVAESAGLAGSTTETLRNVELVKSIGIERQEVQRLNAVNDKILGLELKKVRLIRTLMFIQGTMINAVRSIIMFLLLFLIFKGSISVGEFFTLFIYTFPIFNPLYELGNVATQYQEARASLEELHEVLSLEEEEKPHNPVVVSTIESLAFENVSFGYKGNPEKALEYINIEAKKGETIAFAGPSGSGKTTLIKLLLGLYSPTDGLIKINTNSLEELDKESYRARIGLVSQDTQLFAGTIRENLLFVRPDTRDEECIYALSQAAALTIIERGGKGLDTRIGEGGLKLSGGERQRLAIARALLRNPDLIIFDEATSSLDSITEKAITETIQSISVQDSKTITILVAHRLSTIAHADRIYVLEKGHICETGSHKKLIEKGGLYAAMWREQLHQEK